MNGDVETPPPSAEASPRGILRATAAVVVAVATTGVFFPGLWTGGGLVGGDTYTYYFPQKAYYADRLAEGEFPLWNPLAGHGYPLVGESQTAALSPFNVAAYRLLDLNAAYNAVQLLHYVIAFVFTWLYARRLGLSTGGSLLAGLAFTYAWFPGRISLEWAIATGAWTPAALWCVESFLQTRRWRYVVSLSVVLALQLFAGHFNLAFLTVLLLAVYAPARLWFARRPADAPGSRGRGLALIAAGVACGFALAAAQLLPTWELKRNSQRADVGDRHDPAFGHTPAWAWPQAVAPWLWYGTGVDYNDGLPEGAPGTNHIEAHLYFGLIPLALFAFAVFGGTAFKDRVLLVWLLIGAAALLYTPGWFVPITRRLPGFSFFIGPGRYSFLATFAVAVLAAAGLDRLLANRGRAVRFLAVGVAFALTALDLMWVSRQVADAVVVDNPPIESRRDSELARILHDEDEPVRLFCRGPNVATLLGVSSTPVYLGIGPAAYFDSNTTMPQPFPFDEPPTPEQIRWLRNAGATHVLSFGPLDERDWPVSHLWTGRDKLLNRAWGRREPLFLYELHGGRGRAAWTTPHDSGTVRVTRHTANAVRIVANSPRGGRLVLTELAYPGWEVSVDGEPAEPLTIDGRYRGVDVPAGEHEVVWMYRPASFRLGVIVSLAAAFLLAGVAHLRFWHPRLLS